RPLGRAGGGERVEDLLLEAGLDGGDELALDLARVVLEDPRGEGVGVGDGGGRLGLYQADGADVLALCEADGDLLRSGLGLCVLEAGLQLALGGLQLVADGGVEGGEDRDGASGVLQTHVLLLGVGPPAIRPWAAPSRAVVRRRCR